MYGIYIYIYITLATIWLKTIGHGQKMDTIGYIRLEPRELLQKLPVFFILLQPMDYSFRIFAKSIFRKQMNNNKQRGGALGTFLRSPNIWQTITASAGCI